MRTKISVLLLLSISIFLLASRWISAQGQEASWTPQQLLNPADLAKTLNNPKAIQPIILSVGPQAIIKGSIDLGSAMSAENLNRLKLQVAKLPKDANLVVYCGCCPFDRCPNVRPALALLKSLHFTNVKLLNLPRNVKVDWIDHGYPLSE